MRLEPFHRDRLTGDGLPGRNGNAPTVEHAEEALERMVEAIKEGAFGTMIPFDRHGDPVRLRRGG